MTFPRARLVVSAALFLAWIGYLAYLVAHTRDPVILSRPQLAVSSLVAIAAVEAKDGRPWSTATIKELVWSLTEGNGKLVGQQLQIKGLADCGSAQGWRGSGEYILPLTKRDSTNDYEITPVPLSPGYVPMYVTVELERVGPEKEQVAAVWSELTGERTAPAAGARRGNVPRHLAEDVKRGLERAKASVRLLEGETRIYRATHDALEQLNDLKPK